MPGARERGDHVLVDELDARYERGGAVVLSGAVAVAAAAASSARSRLSTAGRSSLASFAMPRSWAAAASRVARLR